MAHGKSVVEPVEYHQLQLQLRRWATVLVRCRSRHAPSMAHRLGYMGNGGRTDTCKILVENARETESFGRGAEGCEKLFDGPDLIQLGSARCFLTCGAY